MKSKQAGWVGVVLVGGLALAGCGGPQTPRYDVRVAQERDGVPCLSINNYESNDSLAETRGVMDPTQGEMDRSGVYCRVQSGVGRPNSYYPKLDP